MRRSLAFAFAGALMTTTVASASKPATSNVWSGYVATGATFTSVVASWIQPNVTCPVANARASFWVGFDGAGNGTVEQDGTIAVCTAVNSPPTYRAWWEMITKSGKRGKEPFTISPGDVIVASVRYDGGTYALEVQDLTSGRTLNSNQTCTPACSRSSAEWIAERPGSGKYPLAEYGAVTFSGAFAGTTGGSRSISTGGYRKMKMVNHVTKKTLSVPSVLAPDSHGTTFTVLWKAAQ